MALQSGQRGRYPDAVRDQRGDYFGRLEASELPRHHWSGRSPDDPNEVWFFESVIEDGDHIPIRQVTVEADGTRHKYSSTHLEDDWGFLTDVPVRPDDSEGVRLIRPEDFEAEWGDGH